MLVWRAGGGRVGWRRTLSERSMPYINITWRKDYDGERRVTYECLISKCNAITKQRVTKRTEKESAKRQTMNKKHPTQFMNETLAVKLRGNNLIIHLNGFPMSLINPRLQRSLWSHRFLGFRFNTVCFRLLTSQWKTIYFYSHPCQVKLLTQALDGWYLTK